MKKIVSSLFIIGLAFPGLAFAGEKTADEKAVYQAVLDYVEGICEGEPERIKRSVRPDMNKHGFYQREGEGAYMNIAMSFEQLVDLAATWKKQGRIPPNPPKEITVFEVNDQTAIAKLVAFWGMDYFHLAKYDGKWMISQIIWQSIPKSK